MHDIEPLTGQIGRRSMAEMSSCGKVHTEHGIPGFQVSQKDSQVRLASGMGLNVGVSAFKQLFSPTDRQGFQTVCILSASVITGSGIALDGFVDNCSTQGFQSRTADEIF